MRRGIALLTLLAGCAVAPDMAPVYRDKTVPLTVTTRGSLAEMQGDWMVRAAFPDTAAIDRVTLDRRQDGLFNVTISQADCAQTCNSLTGTWPAERIAQNRLRLLTDSASDTELWVIWMDDGIRTAIVATPDGQTAFILDRKASGGDDRIAAARDVMDFNGFDIAQLVMR